jgi:4-amino-4-deoxy-L-arabinose transferase-like glycosyltransferase
MTSVVGLSFVQRARVESVRRTYLLPAVFVLAGLLAPLVFARAELVVRNEDSFEYITGSQSILQAHHYLALSGRPQTVFPPGYSLAIVPFALLFKPILAAKIVSWLSSGVSVLLVFLIGREWFGTRISVLAALLFSLFPLRVWLSQTAQSESLYVMLLLLAIWMTIRIKAARPASAAAVGAIVGWAYLTRPEAVILIVILGLLFLVSSIRTRRNFKSFLAYTAAVLVIVVPYVLWLSFHAGAFVVTGKGRGEIGRGIARLEGKSDVLMRRLSNDDSAIVIATTSPGLRETVVHTARDLELLKKLVLSNSGVQPIAAGFILLGLLEIFRSVIQGGLWSFGLLQLFFVSHLVLYSPFWIEERLLYASSPALCLWMAVGIATVFKLMTRESSESRRSQLFAMTMISILTAAILGSYALKLRSTRITDEKTGASQEMALLILQRPDLREQGVIGEYPGISFFAGTRHEWMPYCDLDQLRRFGSINHASLIAFSEQDARTPATERLLAGNYAAEDAQFVARVRFGSQDLQMFSLSPIASK